ncbi:MAG: sugar:sodium symporter [Ruminococcaceae bacterium]|nr:sugar:sodium symporter [Oscillospiraceae bacterium]
MKLTFKEKASYGLGAVGKDLVYMLSSSYVLYYYQDVLGVNAVAMGIILLVARIFDALNDPVMGIIVAKTRTKWGRFRPWIMIGTLLNAVVLYFLFATPPHLDGKGLVAYAAVAYVMWGVTYTMMDIPFWSMIPAFTESGKEREGLSAMARSCSGVGCAIIMIITMKSVVTLGNGNEREGFKTFAFIISLLFVLFTIVTCIFVKEKSTEDIEAPSVKEIFQSLIRNDQAMTVTIAVLFINLSIYIASNLLIYFFKYDFGGEGWINEFTLFNTFGGAVEILSMMVAFPIFRKFMNAIKIFYTSVFLSGAGFVVILAMMIGGIKNIYILLIPALFIFMGFGMLTVLTTIFLANTVDYGEFKNKRRDESIIFSMQTFVAKFSSGIAAFIAGLCLAIFGISRDTAETAATVQMSESSIMGLRFSMTLLPILALIVAFIIFKKKYILTDEKLEEISAQIKSK